jgi:hypothetical protein
MAVMLFFCVITIKRKKQQENRGAFSKLLYKKGGTAAWLP